MAEAFEAYAYVVSAGVFGILFAAYLFWEVSKVKVTRRGDGYALLASDVRHQTADRLFEIYCAIQEGARAFLLAEYTLCFAFIIVFGAVVLVLTSFVNKDGKQFDWLFGTLNATAFAVGGLTSMAAGYMGMMVAVYANARTTVSAMKEGARGWRDAFNTAFRAGAVMGFGLSSMALLVLFILIKAFETQYPLATDNKKLFEAISGYGLGGSSIAMFGRVGGGIYTKAADVGADLAGKVVENIPEDDPRNPATIADNVGDNVGDVAGMGSDLFGSLAESTCACLIISTQSPEIIGAGWPAVLFPLVITATGIYVSALVSFLATHVWPVKKEKDVETVLKVQLFGSTLLMTILIVPVALWLLPSNFSIGASFQVTPIRAFYCVAVGLWGGCIVGFVTEYFTSHSYHPVREVAQACETGAATNIIYGLALGYKSAIIPITIISLAVYVGFSMAGMYGVSLAALGFLGTLATCLAIDVYGPICDNAGGIAEMSELPAEVRDKTDALDAAGNTTAAIGKGFAIGSAALVSLALFGGFVTRIEETSINILSPITFAGLFMGAMLPYWFTALTMKSVGVAAMEMVKEVKHQFATIPGLLEGLPGHGPPDHARCIKISTDASLREMIPPGLLVMLAPIIAGTFFGVHAVSGLLVGGLTSGVQLAISQSNTGGAWDNAKKFVEKGCVSIEDKDGKLIVQGKGSAIHKAAVVGDTVGDPLKDTSGPALNILMKLMAIISLVFGDFFKSINNGRGLLNVPGDVVPEAAAAPVVDITAAPQL
ncbi:Pyrophosphate-energized vacuolar membrane proton pump [Phytophthora fragariae]|uniref:H(+)-exporting diphosphatase n=2 Tax=Phytophthora TaxID=4783 RepID=A0A6A4EZT1_9STRA|nr:Pyrophosphate-energized vacuolar membrane proton pump [Phytophthora fragariae]KAE9048505.1 Pyrophosphate-energized vacuolar membrane proton pump [Phytophthora rubi]KAE8950320.1 Pyrophosphate-energized vacuolar membrane proton pump [Phytophthora fragariae]KAE9030461.1 Pyrophosphate-energized vacuolar membrane proton pump [Phytophthora fragariae]KAE9051737.1 Pyrophosphate-energized vacuolar membrane proton pump [Phytophthora rubi]